MPRLHQYRNRNACYVLTCISGNVITFQLTSEGERKLAAAGIAPGNKFHRGILLDLYRAGDAFTHGSGSGDFEAIPTQLEIDFTNDPDPETAFPACSTCASVEDLHLTLERLPQGFTAKVQCSQCRAKASPASDTSIPISLLSLGLLKRLYGIKPVSGKHESVTRLEALFQAEFESKWATLRKSRHTMQQSLLDGASTGEFKLG